ncbi:multicopper oxidase family protein [Brevibacillus sp. GCM10020057]|uniref:multicopper oxidase family protein n=1 Tax=Brevibacillus sp. GCM10020057 TaxID=3317327 RepID=UPI00363C7009
MPKFEMLSGIDQGLYLIVWLLTLLPAFRLGGLVFRPAGSAMATSARRTLILTALTLLAVLAQWGTTWWLYDAYGWVFVKDKLLGFLPLILAPAIAAAFVSVPRLWRLALRMTVVVPYAALPGYAHADTDEEQASRLKASAPELAVPLYALSLGAFLAAILQFCAPAVTLHKETLIVAWGVLIAGSSALWIWQSWQQQRYGRSGTLHRAKRSMRLLRACFALLTLAAGCSAWIDHAMQNSKLPGRMSMTAHAQHASAAAAGSRSQPVSVTQLHGPQNETPDRIFTLTAQKTQTRLPSGKVVETWTFNGQYPGPVLRMKQGELIEVVLRNKDIADGVTIHWHGLHVPNAEDGVAGATQDAVLPGEQHVYRFVAAQTGTYWYHSHQQSSLQVKKGLLGALVIEPSNAPVPLTGPPLDLTLVHHKLGDSGGITLNGADERKTEKVAPGTPVRLRLLNADRLPADFQLQGASFQVAAIDGNEVHEPNLLANQVLRIAAGGRYDVTFTMPNHNVLLSPTKADHGQGMLLSVAGSGDVPALLPDLPLFDPASYGSPAPVPFDLHTRYNREFQLVFDEQFGFYDGRLGGLWAINGSVFPHTPMLQVREGDLVKMTFVNRSHMNHPMHLHGHSMLVLSRSGKPITGSPWWTDTLNVAPGETYEVAFRADNPGLWMDHCHDLSHAASGMTMHLVYEGVTSPFQAGHETRNQPE